MYFASPTPGALNNSGFIAFVADTKFSPDRGFYVSPISLSITSATANATIIYTTNGSVPSLTNGATYATPLPISRTTVIRAAAFKDGFEPSNVDTHTYVFVSDVVRQSPNGETPPGWPASWGANVVDYGMDPDVVNDPAYSAELTNDLKSIPSYCIRSTHPPPSSPPKRSPIRPTAWSTITPSSPATSGPTIWPTALISSAAAGSCSPTTT